MRIHDYLEQPESTDQDNFITRLDDSADRVRRSLREFVVAENVYPRLDAMLTAVGARLDDGRDVGRYIYGSFGSGKSHLMTVLGKMLERDESVYDLGHAALRRLRAAHPWLDRRRTLVGADRLLRRLTPVGHTTSVSCGVATGHPWPIEQRTWCTVGLPVSTGRGSEAPTTDLLKRIADWVSMKLWCGL